VNPKNIYIKKLDSLLDWSKKGIVNQAHHFLHLASKKEVIVYGYGAGYIPLKNSVLSRFQLTPKFIIDKKFNSSKKKKTNTFLGTNEISEIKNKNKFIVIISIGNNAVSKIIKEELRKKGFHSIIWAPEIFEYNIHHYGDDYDTNPKLIHKSKKEIYSAFNLLQDIKSKEIFLSILEIYVTHKPRNVKNDPIKNQYFDLKLFKRRDYLHYINCGAYTGDSVKNLLLTIGKIDTLVCIEPDKENFKILNAYCKKNTSKIAKIINLYPLALAEENSQVTFSSSLGLCSEVDIHNKSKDLIQTAKLDDLIIHNHSSFLSMDLEGYEKNAISGMKKIIKDGKTNLAISIYHRIPDLWQILLNIHSLNKKYTFFVRNYTGFTYETVLYCRLR
jgi:FkbM family methyltransferase